MLYFNYREPEAAANSRWELIQYTVSLVTSLQWRQPLRELTCSQKCCLWGSFMIFMLSKVFL